jgi:hypothetical protein
MALTAPFLRDPSCDGEYGEWSTLSCWCQFLTPAPRGNMKSIIGSTVMKLITRAPLCNLFFHSFIFLSDFMDSRYRGGPRLIEYYLEIVAHTVTVRQVNREEVVLLLDHLIDLGLLSSRALA